MSQPCHLHHAFGLILRSAVPLPMLSLAAQEAVPDIDIRIAPAPPVPPQAVTVKQHARVHANQVWLHIDGVGHYWIGHGREIRIEACVGARTLDWYFYLLGSAMMCALAQRGLLPLHGCALEIDGSAVLLLGRSGVGKSTLAVWLDQQGYRVLSDDLCALRLTPDGAIRVLPAYAQAKLAPPPPELHWAMTGSGGVRSLRDKQYVPLQGAADIRDCPLAAVYGLTIDRTPGIQSLLPLPALQWLMHHTQRKALYQALVGAATHRRQCAAVARRVPVFSFARTPDIADFQHNVLRLQDHIHRLRA